MCHLWFTRFRPTLLLVAHQPYPSSIGNVARRWTIGQIEEVIFPSILYQILLLQSTSFLAKKVQTSIDCRKPATVWDVQCFLFKKSFNQIFIQNYPKIVAPLIQLICKYNVEWNSKTDHVFETLKKTSSRESILTHLEFSKAFFLETNASDFALNAILSQSSKDQNLHLVVITHKHLLLSISIISSIIRSFQ